MLAFASKTSVILILALLLSAARVLGAFKTDEPLAFGGIPLAGDYLNARIAWNPVSGRLGLAYLDTKPAGITYAEWQPGAGVVVKETITTASSAVLGLAYTAIGLPHAGSSGAPNITEHAKEHDGKWSSHDTGVRHDSSNTFGSYAVNPADGSGAFFLNTWTDATRQQVSYLHVAEGGWRTEACGIGSRNGTSLVFTSDGVPFAVWGNDAVPVTAGAITRIAGIVTPGAMRVQEITGPEVNKYLPLGKLAVDPDNGEVWVAYVAADWGLYCRMWTGAGWSSPEVIDRGSSNVRGVHFGFAISPSHDMAVMYSVSLQDGSTGIDMAFRDHATGRWATELLTTEKDVLAAGLVYDRAGNLYGLYSGAADNRLHLLSGYAPPAPLYVRVRMLNQREPCVIHVFGIKFGGGFTPHANIWEDGMKVNEVSTHYPDNLPRFLAGNDASPWVDLTSLGLTPYGDNMVQFFAVQETTSGYAQYDPGLPSASFSISVSTTPSEAGLIKTFTRTGSGSGMMLSIDMSKPAQVKDDLATSRWQNAAARTLPPARGKRPAKFPIMTMCAVPSNFFQAQTVETEIDTLARLGFNDITLHDPVWYRAGFTFAAGGTNYRYAPYIIDNERANPDRKLIAEYVTRDLTKSLKTIKPEALTYWTLYDEPSANSMEYIAASPVCQVKFREYLQRTGLTPQYFGVTTWDEVLPTADRSKPKLYYHTAMYRGQQLVDLFKAGTDPLKAILPGVPTTANFSDEVETVGSMFASGVDQFALFEQEGLRLGWTESWMPWTASLQLNGYLTDFLRAAVDGHGTGQFGIYNCRGWGDKLFWDIAAKKVSAIGHGAQQIFDYNWGPYYAMAVDTGSHKLNWYPALQIPNYAIGQVEDYLVGAQVPKSKIALVYSHATDIWTLGESGPAFGQEMAGLWLLLRHLGYPVDIVQEKDIAADKLARDRYAAVFCTARHLLDSAVPPLLAWLKAGGVLYLSPGALAYNQYNEPLGFDARAGIERKAYMQVATPGVAIAFPALKDLMPVTFGTARLETLAGYQLFPPAPAGATVLATFADGSPAVWTKRIGKGLLECSGFFPGLAYEKAGVLTRQERDRLDPAFPSQSSTDWPAAHRALLAALLAPAGIARPVTTSHYLVEADRLEGPVTHPGMVIAITNWTGQPLKNVQITLPLGKLQGVPVTVVNPILSHKISHGLLTVTLNLNGPVDFLVVPLKKTVR